MTGPRGGGLGLLTSASVALFAAAVVSASPSLAAGAGSIDHVEPGDAGVQILYSIPGLQPGQAPELDTLTVTVDGTPLEASAELAASADDAERVARSAVMAIDVSKSMSGERFAQAKLAAQAFLSGISDDVSVGIVAFAGDVTTAQQPSVDRAASLAVLDDLKLSLETRLYDGVVQAIEAAGQEGQRSVLVLSDGRDTSKTELEAVTSAVEESGVKVDVVALAQNEAGLAPLQAIAEAGSGTVLSADDPDALVGVFASQAEALAQQILVTAELPADFSATEGTLSVSIDAAGETFSDNAFVPLAETSSPGASATAPRPVNGAEWQISQPLMIGGLVAAGLAFLLLLLTALGVLGAGQPPTVEERVAAYARSSSGHRTSSTNSAAGPAASSLTFKESALGAAEKALANHATFADSLGTRLDAAGMSLKSSEWLLLHAGLALGAGFLGILLGGLPTMLLFLVGGSILPWLYLGRKKSKRVRAFGEQLADTLQLLSGGLSAGLSLAQSVDTVVRQGSEPMTSEFKRALTEARLGVPLEDAMEAIATRMESQDFKWVVIAVRIQREVGGNLAEVLGQVAATIRERAYLKRQVQSLSAEGKMSAWILGALPVAIFAFLMVTNRQYFTPMFTNVLGWILLGMAVALISMGAFWMRSLIRMEV